MKKPGLYAAILVALLLTAGVAFWALRPREVAVTRPHAGPAVEMVYATGFVEPDQPVSVAARVTAPVARVLVDEGATVRRGQALLLLDQTDQQSVLAEAGARSRGATLAEHRSLTLFGQGWVTRSARDEAVATAQAARAAASTARARLDQSVVRASIDGVVIKRDVEPGDLAVPTRTLMLLGDPDHVRVTATIDERDMARVRVEQKAVMSSDAWPGRIMRGYIRSITPAGDPNQRAFRARLALDGRPRLPLGMTLEVNIISREVPHAMLLPRSAVIDGHVWLVERGRASRRPVSTGIAGATDIEILQGIAANALVIVDPPANLGESERVRIRTGG